MKTLCGIDIGGTKLEGIICTEDQLLSPLCRIRVPTEAERGYDHIIGQIKNLLQQMIQSTGITPTKIGFSTPGALIPSSRLMKNCNTTVLNGKPFADDLSESLRVTALLQNDANCFALAETLFGAGRGAKTSFGVILGTGVGGGIVIENSVLTGHHGIAGEWGHNRLVENGPPCYCGKSGCIETLLSGPAIERRYHALTGTPLKLKDIYAAFESNTDTAADYIIHGLVELFGRALANVINILDPEVIILGGGVSNLKILYTEGVEAVRREIFNDRFDARIIQNELGDSAGVFGAALLTL